MSQVNLGTSNQARRHLSSKKKREREKMFVIEMLYISLPQMSYI